MGNEITIAYKQNPVFNGCRTESEYKMFYRVVLTNFI